MNVVVVEEEQAHEIYASLFDGLPNKLPASYLGVSSQSQMSEGKRTDRPIGPTGPGGVRGATRRSRIVDPADESRRRPSSQFMEFYRKSCEGKEAPSATRVTEPCAPKGKQSRPTQRSARVVSNKETKSQKRRRARLEREREVQREKRIRSMLNSDFTEEDEALYRCLHH